MFTKAWRTMHKQNENVNKENNKKHKTENILLKNTITELEKKSLEFNSRLNEVEEKISKPHRAMEFT